jgi:menaquinol-cytochrome c reductase iron-sulfur subunit
MIESAPPPDGESLSRRNFLKWAVAMMGSAIAAVLGVLGGGYILTPLFKREEERWIELGRTHDFLPGTPTKVEYIERKRDAWITTEKRASAWVLTRDGKDFAVFDPRCTHLGCPFRWDASKSQFLCPCHNGVFGIDGAVVAGPPPRPLDRYSVKISRGKLLVRTREVPPTA